MSPASAFAEYVRPDWVRRLIAMGPSVGGARELVPLDVEEMVIAGCRSAGVDAPDAGADLGDGDWMARLRELVAFLDDADAMHAVGRLMTRQEIIRAVQTRLLVARRRADEPAVAGQRIDAPLVITGPARSGTTILFELLALDPDVRAPAAWEAIHPRPLPGREHEDRRALAECEQELWTDVSPEFAPIHELRADLPVECVTIMAPAFTSGHWSMVGAAGWMTPAEPGYAYHRAALQDLQADDGHGDRRWLLKTPGHLMTMDDLFAAYPDVKVVQTHRDPVKTMPSTVSTTATTMWMRSDDIDVDLLAALVTDAFAGILIDVGERRASGDLPDEQFADVRFTDMMRDPTGTVGAAYDRLGLDFTDEHAAAITEYLENKPRGKFGTHRYTAAQWSLDADALREQMTPYTDRFGIELESEE